MIRRHLIVLLFVFIELMKNDVIFAEKAPGDILMDKNGWSTHCFGRYLVDLPPQAKINSSYKIWGDDVEYVPGKGPGNLSAEVSKREVELKNEKHKKIDGSMFVRRQAHHNDSFSIVSWKAPYSKELMWMDTYLVTSGPWRVFRYSGDVAPEKLDSALSFADSLSTNIRSRDDHEIPIGPGFCIDQGFIAGSDYRSEGFQVGITLPQHPNALITIDASTGAEQDRLLKRVDKFFATAVAGQLSGLKILRKRQRNVGPIEAEEYATAASGNGQRVYAFAWESQGKDKSLSEQNIVAALKVLEQSVITEHTPYRPAFKSDEEALQLWDAIIDSIRLRPGAV
ncbi:T6SS immunity protein Tli4 family protein [Ralstonia pseudosolanacearum]|uniref:T6SS immunity protein Tli4 family protein n=1 Tax=Ralstonia pseudosolanacearum TaxID=1310165 RepID=UPI003D05599E